MIAHPHPSDLSPQDYLAWEQTQPIKHEYINGTIYAMSGGTLNHNAIALNLASGLKSHLRGKGCSVYMADAKVGITPKGPFFYPDIAVTCDPRDKKETIILYHPCLIIEVLSPSTEGFDRGDKFKFYRQIDTFTEYVLINAEKMNIECFRINQSGFWELHPYGEDEDLILESINFSCPLSFVYDEIDLNPSLDLSE